MKTNIFEKVKDNLSPKLLWIFFKDNSVFSFFLLIVSLLMIALSLKRTEIGFLYNYDSDEYVLILDMFKMKGGLLNLSLRDFFSYGARTYGFLFFLSHFIVTLPFLLLNSISGVLIAGRLFSSLWAVIGMIYIYRFARFNLNRNISTIFVALLITIPVFWKTASWFHAEWMMTTLFIMSLYYFAKDERKFGREFWIGMILLCLTLSVKFVPIFFIPALGFYIFYEEITKFDFKQIKNHFKITYKLILLFFGIFICTNPHLLHPLGFAEYMRIMGVLSTNLNVGLTTYKYTAIEKINFIVSDNYTNYVVLFILTFIAIFYIVRSFRKKEYVFYAMVSIYILLSDVYLFFIMNYTGYQYFLPVICASLLISTPLFKNVKKTYQYSLLIVIIVSQVIIYFPKYKNIIAKDIPDLEKHKRISQFIVENLNGQVNDKSNILISSYTGFEYDKLGLGIMNVHIIWGAITYRYFDFDSYMKWSLAKEASRFRPKDFIVLRKDDTFFDKSKSDQMTASLDNFNESYEILDKLKNGSIGYNLFKENDDVVIFKRVK